MLIFFIFFFFNLFIYFFKNTYLLKIFSIFFSFFYFIFFSFFLKEYLRYDFFCSGIFYFDFYVFNNVYFFFDSLSIVLIWLLTILYIICLFISLNSSNLKLLFFLLYLVFFFTFFSFITFNLFYFFIFFESILIPMFLIIGIWGARERKLIASYKFFIYTLIGSVFFLIVILFLFFQYGTVDLYLLLRFTKNLSKNTQMVFWFFLFLSFAVKVPLYPFHTWLPEAHAEAPTVGSIILAGVLLKLGPYGFIRFSNLLFPYGFFFFKSVIFLCCLLGLYYTSLIALRQLDLKKIIAYSSIGHMGLVILGIFSLTLEGLYGSLLLMISHGFVSGGLFLLIGLLYDKYKTRLIIYYNYLFQLNPNFSIIFFLFILGNIAFPLTMNFLSELLIFISLIKINTYLFIFVIFSSFLNLAYNLILYSRFIFNSNNINYINYNKDLTYFEIFLNFSLFFPVFLFGIFNNFFFFLFEKFLLLNIFLIKINLLFFF